MCGYLNLPIHHQQKNKEITVGKGDNLEVCIGDCLLSWGCILWGSRFLKLTGGHWDQALDLVHVIALHLTITRIGHCRFKTCVGDMTAGWEGGAAATFCLSLLKLASSIHDASAEAKELFPLYLGTKGSCFIYQNPPEWIIILQTCAGRSCCCCCLLDTRVLKLIMKKFSQRETF